MISEEVLLARKVPMYLACRAAGMTAGPGRSKLYCPFGELAHPDGGLEPAARCYGDMLWCFACARRFDPPGLCAEVWEVSIEQAAERLLEITGYRCRTWQERLDDASAPVLPDLSSLSEALRMYCLEIAGQRWEAIRFRVGDSLGACCSYLSQVRSGQDAELWLELGKQITEPAVRRELDAAV